jgi:soluble cytochrome b562
MQMLYNSDNFTVVEFDLDAAAEAGQAVQAGEADAEAAPQATPPLRRGGYEIVDKFARKEIFIAGALAESFAQGVQALVDKGPSEEELDDYISGFTLLAQQPLVLH